MESSNPYYDVHLQILPDSHYLKVHIILKFQACNELKQTNLLLHKQFQINSLLGRKVKKYKFLKDNASPIPYIPEAGILELVFDSPLYAGESIWIEMDYEGCITDWPSYSCNVISPDWVELGLYLPWYPMFRDFSTRMNYHLQVQCPPQYHLAGYGEFIPSGNEWLNHWNYPSQDMVVIASPHLKKKRFQNGDSVLNLFTSTFKSETTQYLGENSIFAMSCFENWFGPAPIKQFNLIQSSRQKGGGYGRTGLVVLGGMVEEDYHNRPEVYLRYLAHEFAHAWWHLAPADSWEDWLNEGLAEISAQLVIGERYGTETYHRQIESKRAKSTGIGPIWQFDRLDQSTPEKQERIEHLLYDRGPVILHDLCNKVGRTLFFQFCRNLSNEKSLTTDNMLALVESNFGMDVRNWLQEQLNMI